MLLIISYSESAHPITKYCRWKQVSMIVLEFQYILFTLYINNNKFTYDQLNTVDTNQVLIT